jgi:magnesium chelatase family protein
MITEVFTASTYGVDAFIVRTETHIDNALFSFALVGLPDSAVKESKERVAAAIKNSMFHFPIKRYTVNLAPADVKKEGSGFDLPIAIGILAETSQVSPVKIKEYLFLGELSLDGKLRAVNGVLPIALEAKKNKFKGIILPVDNAKEAAIVEEIHVHPLKP